MDRRLEGKVTIITVAGTGIGEAILHPRVSYTLTISKKG